MIRVKAEDGTIHEFPDEATPEMISQAMGLGGTENPTPVAGKDITFAKKNPYRLLTDRSAGLLTGPAESEGDEPAPSLELGPGEKEARSALTTLPLGMGAGAAAGKLMNPMLQAAKGYGLAGRSAVSGAVGAGEGYAASLATQPFAEEKGTKRASEGIGLGAIFGGMAPAAGTLLNKARGTVEPKLAELADWAMSKGVPIYGSQIKPSKISTLSNKTPFSGYPADQKEQINKFTEALTGTMGEKSPVLTREVMNNAADRIAATMDSVAANTGQLPLTPKLKQDLQDIRVNAEREMESAGPIHKQLDHIEELFQKGHITGEEYQALTRYGSKLSTPGGKFYARQIKSKLDDLLAAHAPPGEADRLREARGQWKNMLTLEDLAEKLPVTGELSPKDMKKLLSQVIKYNPDHAYVQSGDIGRLAEVGTNFINKDPDKEIVKWAKDTLGTATAITGVEGASNVPYLLEHPLSTLASAVAVGTGLAGNRLLNNAINSPSRTQGLINRTLRPNNDLPLMRGIAPAAMGLEAENSKQKD